MHPYVIYALEVTGDRQRQADRHRLPVDVRYDPDRRPSSVRRAVALVFAALSRGSAAAAGRLDDCVADDLRRALAPAE
jgi:hypothetical protein